MACSSRLSCWAFLGLSNEGTAMVCGGVALIQLSILMGAGFIAGMALSGDWL